MRSTSLLVAALAATAAERPRQKPLAAPYYRNELLDLHKELVAVESISGNEGMVGRLLHSRLESRGFRLRKQPVALRPGVRAKGFGGVGGGGPDRFNLLAWKGGDAQRSVARVVVTSHLDVVPPYLPYLFDGGRPVTRRTVLRGRGSVDAKASIAAMVIAMEQLLAGRAIAPDAVMLVFVVGEEVDGEGMRVFSASPERPRPLDAVVFGEPTDNRLACGHKGALLCQLVAAGTPGHSGYPWLGKSANELLVSALHRLIEADLGSSPDFGNTTVNIGQLEGGVASNVIAERALANIAVRVAAGSEADGAAHVVAKIQSMLRQVDRTALALKCDPGYGPVSCDCKVPGEPSTPPPPPPRRRLRLGARPADPSSRLRNRLCQLRN